jgi:ribosomal protein S18 acetylase RimI-like enzyme
MIISNHQLTDEQLLQLETLLEQCRQKDRNTVPTFSDLLRFHRQLPANALYYHRQRLVGFASVFFFYDNACEVVLMVHPDFRRRHIATALLDALQAVIHSRGGEYVIFPSPQGLNNAWLLQRGFQYRDSVVFMQWQGSKPMPFNDDVILCPVAGEQDIPVVAKIDAACFHSDEQEIARRFESLIQDPDYRILMLRLNEKVIGKAHIHREMHQLLLSDIAILPSFQSRGYGQVLVTHCIEQAQMMSTLPLCLEVESQNLNAVHIYEKLGFIATNIYDYWAIAAKQAFHCK